jgi:PGF-pre-PGF domain-containing protein
MDGAKKILIFILIILLMLTGISTAGSSDSAEISVDKGLYNRNAILLKNAQFDTSIPQPAVVSADILSISQYPSDVDGYYIVQFSGYIREEWKQAVSDTGAVIFDYVPNNAFVVRMDPAEKSLVESLDEVQWIGFYRPSYRISPALSSAISNAASVSAMTQEGSGVEEAAIVDIIILLFDAHDNERVVSGIKKLGGEIVDNAGDIIRVRIDGSKIPDIAIMNGVSWIEKYVQPVILNDVAANITNVYDVRNTYGLTGSGQIVAVADTGLDTGVDNESMHDDIEGRIEALHAWWSEEGDTGAEDNNGHGTHVAGSVLGNGSRSNGQYAGMAPEAQLVFQALQYDGVGYWLENGNLYTPTDLSLLFQQAYNDGAKIHSNSWGSGDDTEFGNYTAQSRYVDDFMWNNPDMLIVFAAGNKGENGNGTVIPPGTAKNALTVGASENDRPSNGSDSDNINEIANFSSKGPTDDNRIKPDVVAPGTYIFSTKSSLTTGTGDYVYKNGTSMATPLTAGTAALVRQYYVENESISPSAALLKATLINGAANMSLSSNDQGWGRVDIERSLFPASPRTMRYHDDISLNTSESWNVRYYINNSSEPLRITLVWTDYPAAAYASTTLVNNLDLTVTCPGETYFGNGVLDSVNNVEQVELSSPAVEIYTIKVNGTNIPHGAQPFALVISGALDVTPIAITNATAFPTTIEANGSDNTTFNITATGPGGIASVTMNLTAIGGLPIQTLDNNSGIWQYTTNTTALGTFHLPVNVTDNTGSSNTSVNITLNTTDTTPPTSNTPSNTEFSANTSASFDKWILTDLYPGYYRVLRNGTEIVPPTSWTNYTNITVLVDTNISLGDFNYTIQYNDTAGNNGTQNTVIITINDTTKPILSDNMPLSGTNNTKPTISINATDRGAGINASSAEMKVEGVPVLLSNTSLGFTFNFTNTTTAAYNHGDTVNVTFNVSDNEGHMNNTSWMFYIDTVMPTIEITSHREGYSTTSSSIIVTSTVNGTGSPPTVTVNSVTAVNKTKSINFNGTFSAPASLTVGPNTIHANVTDAAGNTNSTLINVTRTTVSKTSSGGGGGGGGTSGEDFYNIAETETQRVSVFKGDNVSYSFENTQNPILNIKFTAKVSAGKVASKVEVLRNTSTMVDTPPPGKVYQNINIWVGNYGWASEKNIKDLTISFTVPLDWITSNNIDKSSIALYRYNDDSWEQLPTSLTTRNENSITFTSSTPGFSPFAISGETVSIPAVIPTAYHTPAAVATNGSNITSSSQTNEVEPGGKAGTIILWVLFIIVILAVTVIIYQRKDEILQGINNMRQQRGR